MFLWVGAEARFSAAGEKAIEFYQLTALALPTHPAILSRIPLSIAMEEQEDMLC